MEKKLIIKHMNTICKIYRFVVFLCDCLNFIYIFFFVLFLSLILFDETLMLLPSVLKVTVTKIVF